MTKYYFLTNDEIRRLAIQRQIQVDKETAANIKEFGIKQEASINFKQHPECKLFRCLKCWMLIHPDDEITPFKEGFVHKLCSRLE